MRMLNPPPQLRLQPQRRFNNNRSVSVAPTP
jgi:hypothetical protein